MALTQTFASSQRAYFLEARSTPATGSVLFSAESVPYHGTATALPGTIEAEDFDEGGASVAYQDWSPGNEGGAYRTTDVDVAPVSDTAGRYLVGWIGAGEWLNYTVDVADAGTYTIEARVASPVAGGSFHIAINGLDKTGPMVVPQTGGWQEWTTVSRTGIQLDAGVQVMRVVMDTATETTNAVGNIDWIRVSAASSADSTPYQGFARSLPGTIEAEDFDDGGASVAYHDWSPGNEGGAYRMTDVDVAPATDTAGRYLVGWIGAGEWLNYTVDVATAAAYTIEARVASPVPGGSFHIELNGVDKTGPIVVPPTGGWQTWTTVSRTMIPLDAGVQVMRVVMDTASEATQAVGNINWIRVSAAAADDFAITAPAPGTALRARTAVFRWTPGGDDHFLTIGTESGIADVYASGSLGPATEHTVTGLPLSGVTLYVQLGRRLGDVAESIEVPYSAPVRRGLAVITDFADRTLEDWTGEGIRSPDDASVHLRQLEDHWAWLSRGSEAFRWDLIRLQLSQPAVPGSFPGWVEFRRHVAALIRQRVDEHDYDVDGDGILDVAWLITSLGDIALHFAIGGASMEGGVNMFADGQASDSVKGHHTGNFTHEVGHLLGLPDMYGKYGTLGGLSVMSTAWTGIPPDFAAYERIRLGWLTPHIVTDTTRGVWLPWAHENFAAVMVPTSRSAEYFLLEYRRRPPSGYGSAGVQHNGLVVYHVLEGSSMAHDPPIVKVEPADGNIVPGVSTDPNDFLYPGNPVMLSPFVLSSYDPERPEVFRIENIAWQDGGITFDIIMPPPLPRPPNLIANGSFELGANGGPDGWVAGASGPIYGPLQDVFVWPSTVAFSGTTSGHLNARWNTDLWWAQFVTTLRAGEPYLLCGQLKGENILRPEGNPGAKVSVLNGGIASWGLTGTFDWTPSCVAFTAVGTTATMGCRLGFYDSFTTGKLWCDDVTLERLRRAF